MNNVTTTTEPINFLSAFAVEQVQAVRLIAGDVVLLPWPTTDLPVVATVMSVARIGDDAEMLVRKAGSNWEQEITFGERHAVTRVHKIIK